MLSTVKGSWSGRQDTGGSRNDVGAYAGNPQYLINISEAGISATKLLHFLIGLA